MQHGKIAAAIDALAAIANDLEDLSKRLTILEETAIQVIRNNQEPIDDPDA